MRVVLTYLSTCSRQHDAPLTQALSKSKLNERTEKKGIVEWMF